ncbi:hypothetical protein Tco_0707514 [Tanacetum coccineum]|uniref:Uncharacterized protein n=1 Tax=Tanacetum coccineum TaxID=301880 RepID=A0ABQ4YCQ6_9ASTR
MAPTTRITTSTSTNDEPVTRHYVKDALAQIREMITGLGSQNNHRARQANQFSRLVLMKKRSWNNYKEASTLRFRSANEDPMAALKMLRLPTKLEMTMRMFTPKSQSDVNCLTALQEPTLKDVKKKSRPFVNQNKGRFGVNNASGSISKQPLLHEEEEEYLDAEETLVDTVNEGVQAYMLLNALSGVSSFHTMRGKQLITVIPNKLPPVRSHDHRITLMHGTQPANIRPYRHPPMQKDVIDEIVKELLESRLNKHTIKDKFPNPIIEELIDELCEAVIFSTLDLSKSLEDHVQHLTTILSKMKVHCLYAKENQRITTQTQMKWLPKLISFDYEEIYKQGIDNVVVDALSRREDVGELFILSTTYVSTDLYKRIVDSSTEDDHLKTIVDDLKKGEIRKHYSLHNNKLLRKGKMVIGRNESLRQDLLSYFHEGSIGDIIEHLAKDGEKNVFWIINDEDRESLLNLKNKTYHSRQIRYFPRLRQDQYHFLTLKNMPYPHQQIRRIRYFGQHSEEARFPSNTSYPEAPICPIVYDDALSSHHADEVNWKNETSLSQHDDGKYNAISENVLGIDKDLFSYDILSIDNLKLNKEDDEGKIDLKKSSGDIFVEPLRNGLNTDVDTYADVSNMLWETRFDTMYPTLWIRRIDPPVHKKIEKYIRGFPERIKGNITSSKPATLHEAINMARELVEQSIQGRAARIGDRKLAGHMLQPCWRKIYAGNLQNATVATYIHGRVLKSAKDVKE